MDKQEFKTVVKAGDNGFNLKETIRYRDLILVFVKRNFVTLYKQTILGPAWILLTPFMTSVIFTFIFGYMAGMSTDGAPEMLFYLAGNSLWAFFSSAFMGTSNTFIANSGIFGKVYFPRITVPISQVLTSLINFFLQLFLYLICFLYYYLQGAEVAFSMLILYIPVILLQVGILALSGGVIVSSLTTKYRDLAIAVTFGIQLWMYVSPIVYPLSTSGGITRILLLINPMTMPLEMFRMAILGVGIFDVFSFACSWLITILAAIIGIKLFNKIERTFVDTI